MWIHIVDVRALRWALRSRLQNCSDENRAILTSASSGCPAAAQARTARRQTNHHRLQLPEEPPPSSSTVASSRHRRPAASSSLGRVRLRTSGLRSRSRCSSAHLAPPCYPPMLPAAPCCPLAVLTLFTVSTKRKLTHTKRGSLHCSCCTPYGHCDSASSSCPDLERNIRRWKERVSVGCSGGRGVWRKARLLRGGRVPELKASARGSRGYRTRHRVFLSVEEDLPRPSRQL